MRGIPGRQLEGDSRPAQRLDEPLLVRFAPQLLGEQLAQCHRHQCRMGENVHRHLEGETLGVLDMYVHVRRRGEAGGHRPKGVNDLVGSRKEDAMERADEVREASIDFGGKHPPQ